MANTTAKLVSAYFTSQGLKHELTGEDEHVILTGYVVDNKDNIEIGIIFDDNEAMCTLFTRSYCRVPEEKRESIYKVLNDFNCKYRWVRFYMDKDGDVTIDADAFLDMDTCGEECLNLVNRIVGIGDEAYPELMKAIWS